MVIINKARTQIKHLVEKSYIFTLFNKDGFSIHTMRGKSERVLRTLSFDEFRSFVDENVSDNELVHIHYRAASSGAVTLKNVHMWRIREFYVSHNGWVLAFMPSYRYYLDYLARSGRGAEESDTYRFVHDARFLSVLALEEEKAREYISETGFQGVLFATSKAKVVVLSRGKPVHVYYVPDSRVIAFANEDVSSFFAETVEVSGFTLDMCKAAHATISDELLLFDIERMTVEKRVKLPAPQQVPTGWDWWLGNYRPSRKRSYDFYDLQLEP